MRYLHEDDVTQTLDDLYESIAQLDAIFQRTDNTIQKLMYDEVINKLLDVYVELASTWNEERP